jgi:general secretion pathway protein D
VDKITRKAASLILLILALSALSVQPGVAAAATKGDREATFNFVDVDLPVVAKFVSEVTRRNFILDERVKGKITIIAPVKLSIDDTFELFKAVLEMKGFTVIPSGVNAYSIIPVTEARQKGLKFGEGGQAVHAGYAARVIPLKYISAAEVQKLVQPLISKDGYVSVFGPGNLLLVVDSASNIINILSIVDIIDKPSETRGMINIYFLENADATELAKVLESVIKAAQSLPPRQASALAFDAVSAITVTADKASNALIVVASPADYQNLMAKIKMLDKRRRQVFVQAVIAEINLDKLKDLGTELTVSGGGTTGNLATAGVFDPFNILAQSSPQQFAIVTALTALTGNVRIGANVHALFSNSTINVLSTPTIMTSDNKEAEIFVGENVPFVSSTSVTSITSIQSIERKDTGIILRITPQITEGNYLKLDIYQEISAVKDALSKGAAADITTTKRSAKTSVVVKDKDTVVIGGLIQDRDSTVSNKIPLLGDIPLLGWLFKYESIQRQKINLLITLTPRIIKSAQDMKEVSDRRKSNFDQESKSDKPFNLDRELLPAP